MAMALIGSVYCLLLCSLCKIWRGHRDSSVIRITILSWIEPGDRQQRARTSGSGGGREMAGSAPVLFQVSFVYFSGVFFCLLHSERRRATGLDRRRRRGGGRERESE